MERSAEHFPSPREGNRQMNSDGGTDMINFEEEVAKFKPSKEIEEAEDVIVSMNLRDMTDIMLEILKEKEQQ